MQDKVSTQQWQDVCMLQENLEKVAVKTLCCSKMCVQTDMDCTTACTFPTH
jgi:hypothetical protein